MGATNAPGQFAPTNPPRGVSVLALQPRVAAARLNERGPRVMARGPSLLGSLCRPRPACRRRQLWPKCLVGQRLCLSPGIQEGCQGFPVGFPCWIPMSAGSGRVRCSCGGSVTGHRSVTGTEAWLRCGGHRSLAGRAQARSESPHAWSRTNERTAACDRLWRSKDLQCSSTEPNASAATTALPQVGPSTRPGHA